MSDSVPITVTRPTGVQDVFVLMPDGHLRHAAIAAGEGTVMFNDALPGGPWANIFAGGWRNNNTIAFVRGYLTDGTCAEMLWGVSGPVWIGPIVLKGP